MQVHVQRAAAGCCAAVARPTRPATPPCLATASRRHRALALVTSPLLASPPLQPSQLAPSVRPCAASRCRWWRTPAGPAAGTGMPRALSPTATRGLAVRAERRHMLLLLLGSAPHSSRPPPVLSRPPITDPTLHAFCPTPSAAHAQPRRPPGACCAQHSPPGPSPAAPLLVGSWAAPSSGSQ